MDSFVRSSLKFTVALAVSTSSALGLAQEAPPPAPPEAPPADAAPPAATPPVEVAPPPVEAPAPAPVATDAPAPAAAKPKPPPYSLPWQLRPVVAASVVRSDTAWAFFKDATGKESGASVASMLLFSYKVTDSIAPMIRLGVASMRPPSNYGVQVGPNKVDVDGATNFLNPVLGATYAIKPAKPLRLAFFLGVTLPIGSGGGDDAKLDNIQANNPFGIRTRSAMDNAMFSPNDFTVLPGVDFAYVSNGFTVQVEATLLQLMRVKGDGGATPKNPDSSKTNLTMGLHVGYFFIPQLSVGAEIRHQRFLSTPLAVERDEASAAPVGLRDQTTWAIGPRAHFKLSESVWFRPGIAFSMPIDDPMSKFEYKVVQLDLPVAF